jgi:hypothetical protein
MNIPTLDNIRDAAIWAIAARESDGPTQIVKEPREYNQCQWIGVSKCGTNCCMWGAAWELAGNNMFKSAEEAEEALADFEDESLLHLDIAYELSLSSTTPEQILALLDIGITEGRHNQIPSYDYYGEEHE